MSQTPANRRARGRAADPSGDWRIAEIRVHQHDLVFAARYAMDHSELHAADATLVEVVTEDGITGYGETCPVGTVYQPEHALGARAALAEVAPALLGHDARNLATGHRAMDAALMGHDYAKAAVDVALWDLLGKACKLRVCDLLGGALTDRVPSYYALSVAEPEQVSDEAALQQSRGFRRFQLKAGGRPIEVEVETIRRIAAILDPGVQLTVDANRGWTASEAITISRQCADVPMALEQPCNSLEENTIVSHRAEHPIYLDESIVDLRSLARAITDGIAQGFGLKVTRAGGLSGFRALRDLCDAYHMPHSCDDTWGGDIIAAACVHMAATVRPRLLRGAWIAAPYLTEHYDPEHPVAVHDGSIPVPTGHGLGVSPVVTRWGTAVARYL